MDGNIKMDFVQGCGKDSTGSEGDSVVLLQTQENS
jgi:hypothetical protein